MERRRTPPGINDAVVFGTVTTDHMFVVDFDPNTQTWGEGVIRPYDNFSMAPNAMALHYGQMIFEGMKAYKGQHGKIHLFRPMANSKRFAQSATMLAMQPVPDQMFVGAIEALVKTESDWILPAPGSLYIRPFLIPLDEGVTYRASKAYRFCVIVFPAKAYYKKEVAVSVYVERERVRAVPGGVGEAKCAGNYAGALAGLERAKAAGADQVLWLDGKNHENIEEVGAMNVMFVYGKTICTPKLSGSILHGITRDSLLQLGRRLGYTMVEETLNINKVLDDIKSGHITEAFGCGTAAAVTPMEALIDRGARVQIGDGQPGTVTMRLKSELLAIQNGDVDDPFGWRHTLL